MNSAPNQARTDFTINCNSHMRKQVYNQTRSPMYEYRYTVLFEPAEEGGFVATCPALPGLVTEGDTLDEAREMVHDAIRTYLESLQKDGLAIPEDIKLSEDPVKEEIRVALPEMA